VTDHLQVQLCHPEIIIYCLYLRADRELRFVTDVPSSLHEPLCLANGNVPGLAHHQQGMRQARMPLPHLPRLPLRQFRQNQQTKNLNSKDDLMWLISQTKMFLVCSLASKHMLILMAIAVHRETNEVVEI